jgi:hypothetical protein
MLSMLCHFHGLLFDRATLGLQLHRPAQWAVLTVTGSSSLLSISALAIWERRAFTVTMGEIAALQEQMG